MGRKYEKGILAMPHKPCIDTHDRWKLSRNQKLHAVAHEKGKKTLKRQVLATPV
jgi:hypothetical protein